MGGEDVGFIDRGQGDRLMRLDVGERTDTVAQHRRAFEFELGRSLVHALRQCLLNLAVPATQEAAHLVDDGAVLGLVDAAYARRRAAFDLVLQAGPGARREYAVRAGAQRKGALQGIERAVDRGGRGEGAEIFVGRIAHAAMLGELRPLGILADDDIGETTCRRAASTLKRGRKRLIRLFSSSSASASLPVTENSMVRVADTMRIRRVARRVGWV